jgi:peptidoglycan LD-endopeptidase CwlK
MTNKMMTLEESLGTLEIPQDIRDTLELIDVPYLSFDGNRGTGQLVLHRDLANDIREIFDALLELKFPIEKIVPIVAYGWDDLASMADNNTSAFNYRVIYGTTELSNHARGRAIDINPLLNPYLTTTGEVLPAGAMRDLSKLGTIADDSEVVQLFLSRGWTWGGHWSDRKDWQHFQKVS